MSTNLVEVWNWVFSWAEEIEDARCYAPSVISFTNSGTPYTVCDQIIMGEHDTLRRRALQQNILTPELDLLLSNPLSMKQRVKKVKRVSSCPMGHIYLLFCEKCKTLDFERHVYCQNCFKNNHIYVRLLSKCKTVSCCVNKKPEEVESDCICMHEACSVSATCILYRPVLFSIIDMMRLGDTSPFRSVTRSEILLSMNYSKEQDIISTEMSMNSLALFKRFEEKEIVDMITECLVFPDPCSLRGFLSDETSCDDLYKEFQMHSSLRRLWYRSSR